MQSDFSQGSARLPSGSAGAAFVRTEFRRVALRRNQFSRGYAPIVPVGGSISAQGSRTEQTKPRRGRATGSKGAAPAHAAEQAPEVSSFKPPKSDAIVAAIRRRSQRGIGKPQLVKHRQKVPGPQRRRIRADHHRRRMTTKEPVEGALQPRAQVPSSLVSARVARN